jgi:succinyl-CoA synthetase alpha subunit
VQNPAQVESEVKAKMAKADGFLMVASITESDPGGELHDQTVSLCASAAINYSDALLLRHLGMFPQGRNHEDALSLLARCGSTGSSVVKHLRPVLKLKTKAQYSVVSCSAREAADAFKHASRIHDLLVTALGSR